jgi:hypothetical protein
LQARLATYTLAIICKTWISFIHVMGHICTHCESLQVRKPASGGYVLQYFFIAPEQHIGIVNVYNRICSPKSNNIVILAFYVHFSLCMTNLHDIVNCYLC